MSKATDLVNEIRAMPIEHIRDAIRAAQERMARGEFATVVIDTDQIEPMDEMDRAAVIAFFEEPE